MNIDRKATIYQKRIDELESEVERLKRENLYLKQLAPDAEKVKEVQEVISKHQAALDQLSELKKKYKGILREMQDLKKSYKSEMDKLLQRIRNQR